MVDISHIISHRKLARKRKRLPAKFLKSSIAAIDIKIVVFVKIIADKDIRISIEVEVRYCHSQSVSIDTAKNIGFLTHIDKIATVIAKELITCFIRPQIPLTGTA